MTSEEEQINSNEPPDIFKTIFGNNKQLKIQIEVCNYMFSHKYTENVQFGIATSGSEEFGVRCSPTNSLKAPKIVLNNIHSLGGCRIFDALQRTSLCFLRKKEKEINRIHCFLNYDYDISLETMTKIKDLLYRYDIIIDLFVICDHEVDITKYQKILSEKSLYKFYNIQEQNSFVISQSIIDEIFDLYSNYLILSMNEISYEDHLEDQTCFIDANKPPKVNRKRVQASDAQTIYQLFKNKNDTLAKETCDSLGYSKSTYFNIIRKEGHAKEKYKNPDRNKKWESQYINKAVEIIGDHPVLTLDEIIEKTVSETDAKNISKSTLSEYLKSELITLKTVRLDSIARNSAETKQSRKKYCNEVLRNMHKTYMY